MLGRWSLIGEVSYHLIKLGARGQQQQQTEISSEKNSCFLLVRSASSEYSIMMCFIDVPCHMSKNIILNEQLAFSHVRELSRGCVISFFRILLIQSSYSFKLSNLCQWTPVCVGYDFLFASDRIWTHLSHNILRNPLISVTDLKLSLRLRSNFALSLHCFQDSKSLFPQPSSKKDHIEVTSMIK